METVPKYHIDGTEEFGYSCFNRFLYSFYMYKNTVKRITDLYRLASVQNLKGYVAHYCYLRLKSFDTFLKVLVKHEDYVSANCLLRMLGDNVAIFRLIYGESDEDFLLLRHALYVIDGCERSLEVLPEKNVNEGVLSEKELKMSIEATRYNREHRKRMMREAQEILDASPLQHRDKAAFDKIVEDRNWKFKEFKEYRNKGSNQYQWRDLYKLIDCCDGFDVLSYISQYAHGLSMSNLVIELNEHNVSGVISEALGLIRRLHNYTLKFFALEQSYILEGLLDPEMRNEILACFDEQHRPDIDTWNQDVMNKLNDLRQKGYYDVIL